MTCGSGSRVMDPEFYPGLLTLSAIADSRQNGEQRMKPNRFHFFILSLLGLFACDVDHGLTPMPGKMRAKVVFQGTAPEYTQGIYLMVAPQFPPRAINELLQSPNSLPIGQDTLWTEIDLPYGHYEAFGLWWYSKDTRSNLADILSMPFDGITGEPLGFDITPEEPVAEKDLRVNWSNVARDASIEGTVTFLGDFPPETDVTAVAAFYAKPTSVLYYLIWLKSIDITVKPGVMTHHFTLPVKSGYIGYIAVFWLPQNTPIYDIKIIAECMDPENPDEYWARLLAPGETVKNADIEVDWNHIQPILPEEIP